MQCSTDLKTWESIATKPGINGEMESYIEHVTVDSVESGIDRYEVTVRDARPRDTSKPRYYRLMFYLVS